MKRIIAFLFCFIFYQASAQPSDSVRIRTISDEIFLHGQCYKNLEFLCKRIGPRLSGSDNAAMAVDWAYTLMKNIYGFDTVYRQECAVPHWVRGEKEEGTIKWKMAGGKWKIENVDICALGGSIGTPGTGVRAEVIEVKGFEELKKLGSGKVEGKIVFYNRPFDLTKISTFEMYGGAVDQRSRGAVEAARLGAVGTICRSMTPALDDHPHTGAMHYNDSIPKIPACAISTEDADLLSEAIKRDSGAQFFFKMNCKSLPDVKSFNVIGELKGSVFPNEIIAIGGHLDSWDLGEGAHDDGAGCVEAIEVLRTLKTMGIKPKRTIRVVLWMNEENGLKGAIEYARQAELKKENHILAIETDGGGASPKGFSMTIPEEKKQKVKAWKNYFYPYGVFNFDRDGGGADTSPLEKAGVPVMGLLPDSQRYFDYHHAATDKFENVNKRELELSSVVLTMMVWLVSEYGL